ncbi:competence protein ComEA [Herbaspirillum sp. Sphag1AN]|uniref:ComEA family DNA-binding protein n=1 Tax=unclassified Herbaspirillum TaxID=2624150 RepID=UPI00161B1EAF|nr:MULTISPECIES: helix-hairpin-helix domain-containing protein [unclassified Herbaspirillum]MBB3211375.1 competence protein ComEA [Herbaspirillum sp. Sphag1AN]MBB3245358.1 competence protein ComEA [Herbaspirillum sp. Sphag64]
MFKKVVAVFLGLAVIAGSAMAQVDVNKADQAALDGIKGIGPAKSSMILEERKKGSFKDWADFESRVKGIGGKSAVRLSDAGLTVNGKSRDATTTTGKKAVSGSQASDKLPNDVNNAANKAAGTKN